MRAVNLLPRNEPRSAAPNSQTKLAIAAPFFVAGVLALGFFYTGSKVKSARSELAALQQQLAALPPPKTVNNVNPALQAQNAQRVAALATALSQRIAWDRILREISSVLPDDVWLTSLNVTSTNGPAAAVTAVATPSTTLGNSVKIIGYTYSQESVARLLARLQVIPELTNVTLSSSGTTTSQGHDVVAFTVEAGLRAAGASS